MIVICWLVCTLRASLPSYLGILDLYDRDACDNNDWLWFSRSMWLRLKLMESVVVVKESLLSLVALA